MSRDETEVSSGAFVNDCHREALHIQVDTSPNSGRLVCAPDKSKHNYGLPQILRSDRGSEFMGEALKQCAKLNGVVLRYIRLGKLGQNPVIERLNRAFT